MGYELNRLMQQYGVSTPVLSYSGMQKPVKPVDLAATASTMDRANYDALLAKYNADLPLYQSDQDKYKTYSDDYKNRLATTSMYDAPQFQRGAMSSPGTGMFTDQYSQMYQDVLGRAPDPAGLAYWKGKFGDTISSDEYSEFMQSAQREMGSRPPTNLPVSTARTVLNQPTYSTPTQAPILQTATNNPVTNTTIGEPPAGGENPPNTTPDWGTTDKIGQTLSRMGLTTVGGYLQDQAYLGSSVPGGGVDPTTGLQGQGNKGQTGLYGDAAAGMPLGGATGPAISGLPSSFVGPSDQEGMTLNPNPTGPMVAISTPVSRGFSDTATALSTNLSSGIPSSVVSDAFTNAMTGATTYSNAAIADAFANAMSGGDTSGSSEGGGYGGLGGAYSGGSGDPALNAKGGYIKGYEDGGSVGEGFGYGEGAGAAQGAGMGGYGSSGVGYGEGYGDFDNISSTLSSRTNTQKAANDFDMAMLNQSSRPVVGGYNNAVMVSRESQDSAPYANAYGYQDAQQARDAYDSFVAEQSMSREGAGGNRAKGGYIKGYANGGPVDSRLYGETDEVATGPGYSVPPIDPRLQSLASKYQQPGFLPSFASGSIDPGQSQMDMIRADALQNGLGAPVINISADKPPMSSNMAALQKMLLASQSQASPYADELRTARAAANRQTVAFNKMLQDAIKGQEDSGPSKAETYFRLAAAFGAPTKTGHFAESLAEVNKSMADQAKETRLSNKAGQALKLQLGLEGAKAGMATAREDVNALRALTGEEMKEKASAQRELIKEYFKSSEAQSTFGKQAQDEGLTPGTAEYQARVTALSDEALRRMTAGADAAAAAAQATAASIARSDAAAQLAREKFEASKAKTKADAAKLSGPEIKMKDETSQALVTMKDAYADLVKALELSANAYDGSLVDQAQYKLLSEAGSKDPKVINTGVLDNLLKLGALSTAATTLKTQISDSDMKMLNQVQGAGAKSRQERDAILKAAMVRLENMYREKKSKLADITSGKYRIATPEIAEEIE